jgi:integrase
VPVHPLLRERLTAYAAGLPKSAAPRPYFFCAPPSPKFPLGDRPIDLRALNARFQELAGSLGVRVGRKDDGLVVHSLRHFFETCCVNSRVPQLVVDAWMGHAGDGSMARVYYGRSDGASRKFMRGVRFVKAVKSPQTQTETQTQGSNP